MSGVASEVIELSVVIPVYRNEATLAELHARLCAALAPVVSSLELVFVVDASPDDSIARLRELAEDDTRVAVIELSRNVGQHAALFEGLAQSRGQWICTMDADLQDPPEALPELLAARSPQARAIFGGRRGNYESTSRLWSGRLYRRLLHRLTGVPADAGLFVLMAREVVDGVLFARVRHPSLVALIGLTGAPIVSVPVVRHEREVGKSSYSAWRRLKAAFSAVVCVIEHRLSGRPSSPARSRPANAPTAAPTRDESS